MAGEGFKIRKRNRRGRTEYQVVAGRQVGARYKTLAEAQRDYPKADLDVSVLHEEEIERKQRT